MHLRAPNGPGGSPTVILRPRGPGRAPTPLRAIAPLSPQDSPWEAFVRPLQVFCPQGRKRTTGLRRGLAGQSYG